MEQVHIGEWILLVDVPKTKSFYARMSYQNESSPWLNYIEVSSFADEEVQAFFNLLGVDMLKPSQLSYYPVEEGTRMMYTGSYYLYGEQLAGELDGWDMMIGDFCFSLTQEMEAVPEEMSGKIVEISFEAVLPWMLALPISSR